MDDISERKKDGKDISFKCASGGEMGLENRYVSPELDTRLAADTTRKAVFAKLTRITASVHISEIGVFTMKASVSAQKPSHLGRTALQGKALQMASLYGIWSLVQMNYE